MRGLDRPDPPLRPTCLQFDFAGERARFRQAPGKLWTSFAQAIGFGLAGMLERARASKCMPITRHNGLVIFPTGSADPLIASSSQPARRGLDAFIEAPSRVDGAAAPILRRDRASRASESTPL